MKNYSVNYSQNNNWIIDGKGTNKAWNKAHILTDFSSPWDLKEFKKIELRSLYNNQTVFFCFKVYDSKIHIDKNTDTYKSINNSDRVELFFRTDETLSPYYCLEIDPTSRLMDFKAYPNKDFDFNWNWQKEDIEIKSDIQETYFTVEISISLASLRRLKLLINNQIEAGIFRAKYDKNSEGNYHPTWITWVDPKTEIPNFHISSSFGVLQLNIPIEENNK